MGVLPDWRIEQLAKDNGMIVPYSPAQKRAGVISYGVSSYGYDARIGYKFKVFTNVWSGVIDPKNMPSHAFVEVEVPKAKLCVPETIFDTSFREPYYECRTCQRRMLENEERRCGPDPFLLIPPNSFVLGETLEVFDIPRDILVLVVGKSTLARCGLIVNVTPGEPEWKGRWTVEISNTANLPAKVYPGEGIMQCVFLRGESPCKVSYKDKQGKYQDQTGMELPRVD